MKTNQLNLTDLTFSISTLTDFIAGAKLEDNVNIASAVKFDKVPDGTYACQIQEVKFKKEKRVVSFRCVISHGKHKSEKFWVNYNLNKQFIKENFIRDLARFQDKIPVKTIDFVDDRVDCMVMLLNNFKHMYSYKIEQITNQNGFSSYNIIARAEYNMTSKKFENVIYF